MNQRYLWQCATLLLSLLPFSAQSQTFAGQGNLPVPPGAPAQTVGITTSNAIVTGVGTLGGCVTIDNVTIDLQHTFVGDIGILLIGPGGQVLELSTSNGGGGDDYAGTVFTDNTGTFITSGSPPYADVFRPEGRQQNLNNPYSNANPPGTHTFASTYNGTNANGVWQLYINDYVAIDVGLLISWSITFNVGGNIVADAGPDVTICPGTPTTLTANATPAATSYNWSVPGGNMQSITVSPNTTTTYTVTVTNNGCTGTDQVTVFVNNAGINVNAGPDKTICNGQSTTLSATGSAGASYLWSDGQGGTPITVSPSSTTIYTVTATNATGCTAVDQVQVSVSPAPTANAGPDLSICTGQVRTLTATGGGAPNTYSWSTGQNGANITVSPANTTIYTVTVSLGPGCSSTDEVEVSVEPPPTVDAGPDETICSGENVTLNASGGPGSFQWSGGGSGSSITVSPVTTTIYTVTVVAANGGCTATDNVRVNVNPTPVAGAGVDRSICSGASVQLTATGGGTYQWDTGQTSPNINVSPAATTTYTVTVTGAGGCTDEDEVIVNVTETPVADAGPDVIICRGATAFLSASGGSTYLWNTGQTGPDLSVSPITTTTYTVRAFNGTCESSDQVLVTVAPAPSVSAGNDRFICDGQNITLTASGSIGNFEWNTGETTQNIVVSPSTTTTYTVTLTASNSCTATDDVTVNVIVLSPTLTSDQTICAGQNVNLVASGGGTYRWNTGPTSSSITVTPVNSTTYTVTITQGSCSSTLSTRVDVIPLPVANAGPDQTICPGTQATLTATGGASYSWSDGTQDAIATVSPNASTTYTVTVSSASGGCTATDQVRVNVAPSPVASAGADKTVCEGASATLSATGGGSYSWNTGDNTAGITVTPAVTTVYAVTVTNSNGCTDEAQVLVTVAPVPTADAGPDVSICQGETAVLTGNGGDTYSWNTGQTGSNISVTPNTTTTYTVRAIIGTCSATDQVMVNVTQAPNLVLGNNRFICQGQNTTLTASGTPGDYLWNTGDFLPTLTVSPATTTIYTVTVTAATGCTAEASITVNVAAFQPTLSPSRTLCIGETATLAATGGGSYQWNTGQNTPNVSLSPNATTTYTVTITQGACSSVLSTTLQVLPAPVADAGADISICAGTNANINAGGGTTYIWSSGQQTANFSVSPAATTTYTVTVSNGNCSDTDELTVVVNNNPVLTTSAAPTLCAGQSANLSAAGNGAVLQFAWTTGSPDTSITITPVATTSYTVTATNAAGCTAVRTILATVNPLPPAAAGPDIRICAGNTPTLTAGGGGTYRWSTGETATNITVTPATSTTYTVSVTLNGCEASDEILVTVDALPVPTITPALTLCAGESATLNAGGGTLYVWDNNVQGNSISVTPTSTTTYTVTVTNAANCSATTQTTVSVTPLPNADAGPDQIICAGESAVLNGSGGGTYQWSSGGTNAALNVTPPVSTTYQLTVTANGCQATDVVVVTVNPIPQANAGPNIAIATGQTADIHATGGGTYQWSNGETGASFSISPAVTTTYTVTVSLNGCQSTDEITVFVNEPPIVDLGPDQTICRGQSVTLIPAAGVPPGTTFLWSDGSTTETLTVTPSITTDYGVILTANNLSTQDTIRVNVNQLPLGIPSITGNDVVCAGTTAGYSIAPVSGATNYVWNVPSGATIVSGQGTTQIEIDWTGATPGPVTVNAENDCGQSPATELPVTIREAPLLVGPLGGNLGPCAVSTGTYSIPDNPTATSYQWSLAGNGIISSGQGSNSVIIDWNNSTGGTLCVMASNECGTRNNICIDVNTTPVPIADAGLPVAVCGNDATLSGAGAGVWALLSGPGTATFKDANDPAGEVSVTVPGDYTFTRSISANGCSTTDTVTARFRSIPQFISAIESCNATNTAFTVTLGISGGTAPYTLNGQLLAGTSFTSQPFNSGSTYTYSLSDVEGCEAATLVDSAICNCSTQAGAMNLTPLTPCVGDSLRAIYLGGAQLDGDDVVAFALHTGQFPNGVLATASSPVFAYDPAWLPGYTYYISAVTGSDVGNGLPQLSDPCLSYSAGVPVQFRPLPSATLQGTADICAGTCTTLSFEASGTGPYVFEYTDGNIVKTLNAQGSNATLQVCPQLTSQYRLTKISDAFCSQVVADTARISVAQPPSARIKAGDTVCNTTESGFSTTRNFDDYIVAGDKGGKWLDLKPSGASGAFPNLDFSGVAPGIYTFSYQTNSAIAPCTDSTYTMVINVTASCACPPIGLQTTGPLCAGVSAPFNLNQLVVPGSAAGSWTVAGAPAGAGSNLVNNNNFTAAGAIAGTYRLAYTLTDIPPGTCATADTISLILSAAPNAGTALSTLNQCADNPQPILLNGLLNNADPGGSWSSLGNLSGTVFNAGQATFNPAGQSPGTYQFQYVVPATPGCPADSTVVSARINPLPAVDAGPDRLLTCGAPTASLGLPGGSQPNTTYQWSNGTSGVQITVSQAGVYVLTATQTTTGCINQDRVVVTRDAALPEAVIQANNTILNCLQTKITLTGSAGTQGVAFEWLKDNTALGSTGSIDVTAPGCYVFRVTNTANNCADTAQVCILENKQEPSLLLSGGGILDCNHPSVKIQANSNAVNAGFQWQTANGSIVGNTNTASIDAGAPGVYQVLVTNTDNGCTAQKELKVDENKTQPLAQAGVQGTLGCKTNEVTVNGNGSSNGTDFSYLWTTTDGQINGANDLANIKATKAGVYTLTVLNLRNGCTATDTAIVVRNSGAPVVLPVTTTPPSCPGVCNGHLTALNAPAGVLFGLNQGQWSSEFEFDDLCSGKYTFRTQDAYGCEWDTLITLPEPLPLVVYLGPDLTLSLGESFRLNALTSRNVSSFHWSPNVDTSNCTAPCREFEITPFKNEHYTVSVTDINGCTATDDLLVLVKKVSEVYIPNVFTPDKAGPNSVLTVFTGPSVAKIHTMGIYNRWGELIFERFDPRPGLPEDGWDGRFNGKNLNPGVFVYVVKVEYIDGRMETFSGDVTLVR